MPELTFKEMPPEKFKKLNDIEKAKYLLTMPVKMQSDKSAESWAKCFEIAQARAQVSDISAFWDKVRADMERELKASADKLIPETEFTDVSNYTENGTFNALKFINDKRHCKTTWDGHILSAEDVQTARELMAQGTSKEIIHDTIKKKQHEQLRIRTRMQADKINATPGKRRQPYCTMCMNRGYNAVIENEIFISLHICDCLKRYEQAMDKKREEEQKAKKRKGRKKDNSDEK